MIGLKKTNTFKIMNRGIEPRRTSYRIDFYRRYRFLGIPFWQVYELHPGMKGYYTNSLFYGPEKNLKQHLGATEGIQNPKIIKNF